MDQSRFWMSAQATQSELALLASGCISMERLRFEGLVEMSHLKSLKLTSAQPRANADPSERIRGKVIMFLREQKKMAEAEIVGTTFSATRTVWQKDEQGRRYPVEKPKRVRAGWFEGSDGKTYFSLRYAGTVIELAKDRNAVEVPTLAELPTIIEKLIEATKAGELDAQLLVAASRRRTALGPKDAAK